MSFGGKTETTTVQNKLPEWYENAGKDLVTQAQRFYATPFQKYTDPMVAGLSSGTQSGIDRLNQYLTGGNYSSAVNAGIDAYNTMPQVTPGQVGAQQIEATSVTPGQVGTDAYRVKNFSDYANPSLSGRIIDEGGPLGALSDYINPSVQATLDPTIREIGRAADAERTRIGGGAINSGAFGSARQGTAEAGLARNEMEAVGDATGRAHSAAWNQAMGLRAGDRAANAAGFSEAMGYRNTDLNRQLGVETGNVDRSFNAGLANQSANFGARKANQDAALTAALANQNAGLTAGQSNQSAALAKGSGLIGAGQAGQNMFMDQLSALFGVGQVQQQQKQNELDADYGEFNLGRQDSYDRLASLVGALSGTPFSSSTTETRPKTNYPLMQLLGSLGGAFF